jgi:hypothetical protein
MVATIFVRRIVTDGSDSGAFTRLDPSERSFSQQRRSRRGGGIAYDALMLGPTRPVPRVGARARIKHFGGGVEQGTVVTVHDDGRRVGVRGEDGELYEFVLSPANARFVSAESAHGSRLELLGESN